MEGIRHRSRKRLNYQVNSSLNQIRAIDDDDTNSPMSPAPPQDNSEFSRHRSILMENQLDLNESEIDYYEEVVNDLVEKLDKLREEKDDVQSICNSLGERLQKLHKDSEDSIQRCSLELISQQSKMSLYLKSIFSKCSSVRKLNLPYSLLIIHC